MASLYPPALRYNAAGWCKRNAETMRRKQTRIYQSVDPDDKRLFLLAHQCLTVDSARWSYSTHLKKKKKRKKPNKEVNGV